MSECRHARTGVVKAGSAATSYAVVNVCDRPECIAEAIAWADRVTFSRTAVYLADQVGAR